MGTIYRCFKRGIPEDSNLDKENPKKLEILIRHHDVGDIR